MRHAHESHNIVSRQKHLSDSSEQIISMTPNYLKGLLINSNSLLTIMNHIVMCEKKNEHRHRGGYFNILLISLT